MLFKNISGYKFVNLTELEQLKNQFKQTCYQLKLKGTILLSLEGININVVGIEQHIVAFQNYLFSFADFWDIDFKQQDSDFIPFKRMLVKIKKEIITLGKPQLDTSQNATHTLSPIDLKQWLDEEKEIVLLDTRNDYEISIGSFQNSKQLYLQSFREIENKIVDFVKGHQDNVPIVMFCTGGVRCEKVLPIFLELGVKNIFQLQGGILNYFQTCGATHYQGECFVFDERIAVDTNLNSTDTILCAKCQTPVTLMQQKSENYFFESHCPRCSF